MSKKFFEADPHFGKPLSSVAERDIDFVLLEEFHSSHQFVVWFCEQIGLSNIVFDGAWRSVFNSNGETDLLLRVRQDQKIILILIENKIDAAQQYQQAERYHIRGAQLLKAGASDYYKTVLCAPKVYLDALNQKSVYEFDIDYERVANWFGTQVGQRSAWRQFVMLQAISQGREGYQMVVDSQITAFQHAYWKNIQNQHPRLKMARPGDKGGMSYWIILKGHEFPKRVQLHHKFRSQTVELSFTDRNILELIELSDWNNNGIMVLQRGKDASLAIEVPFVDVKSDFEPQLPLIEQALEAAYKLLPYAHVFERKQRIEGDIQNSALKGISLDEPYVDDVPDKNPDFNIEKFVSPNAHGIEMLIPVKPDGQEH